MRILVHDYSGHPFQVELSRELSRRGHAVVHSHCAGDQSGKGRLAAEPGETLIFDPVGEGVVVEKLAFARRLAQEARLARELLGQVRRHRPDVVLASNVPVPMLVLVVLGLLVRRTPWVLWHQDVQSVALRSFAGQRLSRAFVAVAAVFGVAERWCARRSAAVVVIADSFLQVHRDWGTADRAVVIPNWAPVAEVTPRPRENPWSARQGLDGHRTLLYAGTLGLKHDPSLLVALARRVADLGQPVRLVVVNEGPAVELLQREAARLGVPLVTRDFQPYADLPDVLGSGDVLVVLLEKSAGAFSVPSKTLSYLCAGRPVLGLMPPDNPAATLVTGVGGLVVTPEAASLDEAARWAAAVLGDDERRTRLGAAARELAEREFALSTVADRFEPVLARAARR